MSKRTANNRFIVSSMPRFYQQLLNGVVSYEALGNRIIKQIKAAHAFRQVEQVRELSVILSNFPLKEYRLIGQYYLVWCDGRESKYDTKALERIIEQTAIYTTKALLSLGAFEIYQGKVESSLYYYTEAFKTPLSISDYIVLSRSVAAIKSDEGFHSSALRDLENLLPIIRYAEPQVYYDYLNSYAVELMEVGRIEEARNVCNITLASPYTFAYPEWRETWQDLTLRGYKSRSSVPIIRKIPVVRKVRENVLYMSERERSEGHRRSPFYQPRDVSTIADWKEKKMGKEPNGNGEEKEELSDKQMVMKIMEYATDDDMPDEALHEMLEAIKKISRSYKSKKGKS